MNTTKDYSVLTYADGYGIWHAFIEFTGPMGNSGEAERIIHNAMDTGKRHIRREIAQRQSAPVKRLAYEVKANEFDHMNLLWSLTIAEK